MLKNVWLSLTQFHFQLQSHHQSITKQTNKYYSFPSFYIHILFSVVWEISSAFRDVLLNLPFNLTFIFSFIKHSIQLHRCSMSIYKPLIPKLINNISLHLFSLPVPAFFCKGSGKKQQIAPSKAILALLPSMRKFLLCSRTNPNYFIKS